MFRSRRSAVIKRLWNLRLKNAVALPDIASTSPADYQAEEFKNTDRTAAPNAHHGQGQQASSATVRAFESILNHLSVSEELEEADDSSTFGDFKKSEANDFYDQLSLEQLEELLEIVKSVKKDQGGVCILWSGDSRLSDQKLPLSRTSCHLYRWPDVTPRHLVLRPLPFCKNFQEIVDIAESVKDRKTDILMEGALVYKPGKHVCCNPYHWSRVLPTGWQYFFLFYFFIKLERPPSKWVSVTPFSRFKTILLILIQLRACSRILFDLICLRYIHLLLLNIH